MWNWLNSFCEEWLKPLRNQSNPNISECSTLRKDFVANPSGRTHFRKHTQQQKTHLNIVISLNFYEIRARSKFSTNCRFNILQKSNVNTKTSTNNGIYINPGLVRAIF